MTYLCVNSSNVSSAWPEVRVAVVLNAPTGTRGELLRATAELTTRADVGRVRDGRRQAARPAARRRKKEDMERLGVRSGGVGWLSRGPKDWHGARREKRRLTLVKKAEQGCGDWTKLPGR